MEKAYSHQSEENLYQAWENSGKMRADENSSKPSFTIPLPPPNVTGTLHLGHAAMLAIEDILIRFKKMTGHEVLWVPGTDHAAIATENVVIKHLGAKSREEYSREDFLGHCREFAADKHDTIVTQMKKMGAWLDWSREAYTFDEARNFAVNKIFKDLYEDGLIVRGHRLINWSVGAQSVLADDEVEWEDRAEPFYYIKCGKFVIGTVRSETKCADSPVVVHPTEKYVEISAKKSGEIFIVSEHLWRDADQFDKIFNQIPETHADFEVSKTFVGKELVGEEFEYDTYAGKRKFFVVADEVIDIKKGSGAMTISCNHSADDYDLGKRLKLDDYFFDKLDFEGRMTDIAGPCARVDREKARKKSAEIMREMGILVGEDKSYVHNVPLCYRSGSVVEPMVSPQWFIAVEQEFEDSFTGEKTTLKKQMQAAVRENHVKIIPERFDKEYFRWIDNLQDWCISRQIWWGHRIPVWYDNEDNIVAVGELTKDQKKLDLRQDEDTLDTWFSSALWPFSTLGWPDAKAKDFQKFYPTSVLETGWDILFFWVARMIMFGKYATGAYPFHTVYLHGMVTDEYGKKMSKSKGNGIDPLDMISEFGADPVRLALVIGSTPGQKIPIGKAKISGYRNFVNKLWNAGRFVQMQCEQKGVDVGVGLVSTHGKGQPQGLPLQAESLAEKWILHRLGKTAEEVKNYLEKFDISKAGDQIYHFVWNDFCDWFIEVSKVDVRPEFLAATYAEILKLAHPLCPFVTEQIWKDLFGASDLLLEENFPQIDFRDEKSLENFELLQEIIGTIRSIRAEKKLNPKEKLVAGISVKNIGQISMLESSANITKLFANLSELRIGEEVEKGEHAVSHFIGDLEISVEIPFDPEAEKARLEKEMEQMAKKVSGFEGRLANKSYTEKAPSHLVEQTREELVKAQETLAQLKSALEKF